MHTACSSSSQLWVGGGGASASVHAKIHPRCGPGDPLVLAWRHPLGVDLDTLPQARPLNFPLGVGLETPQARPLKLPLGVGLKPPRPVPSSSPLVWTWRHPQVWAWRPPKVLAWRPPKARPLNFPPGCGPGDPPRPDPSTSHCCGAGDPLRPDPSSSLLGVGLETPRCEPADTPKVWARRPPRPDHSTSPLGVGLETPPPGQTPQTPPCVGMETCKACRIPPERHAGISPCVNRMPDIHV